MKVMNLPFSLISRYWTMIYKEESYSNRDAFFIIIYLLEIVSVKLQLTWKSS